MSFIADPVLKVKKWTHAQHTVNLFTWAQTDRGHDVTLYTYIRKRCVRIKKKLGEVQIKMK